MLFGQISTGGAYTGLLLADDEQSAQMAIFLATTLSDPVERIASLTIKLASCRTVAERSAVLLLDIGSLISVKYTPDRIGVPIDQYCVVEGIRLDVNRRIDVTVTLQLGAVLQYALWTVEDPIRGALDEYGISF